MSHPTRSRSSQVYWKHLAEEGRLVAAFLKKVLHVGEVTQPRQLCPIPVRVNRKPSQRR